MAHPMAAAAIWHQGRWKSFWQEQEAVQPTTSCLSFARAIRMFADAMSHSDRSARKKTRKCSPRFTSTSRFGAETSSERAEKDPKVFTKIHFHFTVRGRNLKSNLVERAIKLSHEKYCSASIMLEKTAELTHSFEIIDDLATDA